MPTTDSLPTRYNIDPRVRLDGAHDKRFGILPLVSHHVEENGDDFPQIRGVRTIRSLKSRLIKGIALQGAKILLVAHALNLPEGRVFQRFQDVRRSLAGQRITSVLKSRVISEFIIEQKLNKGANFKYLFSVLMNPKYVYHIMQNSVQPLYVSPPITLGVIHEACDFGSFLEQLLHLGQLVVRQLVA